MCVRAVGLSEGLLDRFMAVAGPPEWEASWGDYLVGLYPLVYAVNILA